MVLVFDPCASPDMRHSRAVPFTILYFLFLLLMRCFNAPLLELPLVYSRLYGVEVDSMTSNLRAIKLLNVAVILNPEQ